MSDFRNAQYYDEYFSGYPDNLELKPVADYFRQFDCPPQSLEFMVGDLLRASLDEVIDMPRTGRFSLEQLEKTEKTYIGTKVEIVFRAAFNLPKGAKLDLQVDGVEVDVKNTIGGTWTIPQEALGEVCVLLQEDDNRSAFNFGLLLCRDRVLNVGRNRDGKRSVSSQGKNEILWLVRNGALPPNFFLRMPVDQRERILSGAGGARRLADLFRTFQGEVISRRLVECLAQQRDYMKRIRGNGGARDILLKEGLVILWGGKTDDRATLTRMGYKGINGEHFVCLPLPT
ncbi:MAG: NaeI family type II restriction endonuclease [Pseudomonas sp.]